uniref:Uncharacterized protein n=1 Tax=viral metagenome TaxID=1070528 RepID=A0A6C0C7U6_9ZZZZ
MSTEYLSLINDYESRPELMSGLNRISTETKSEQNMIKPISVNENKFINMTLNQIFDKLINILPNMYNDYYNIYLKTKIILKNTHDEDINESDIYRESMRSFLFENENIIFLGLLILIISIFLYIIN